MQGILLSFVKGLRVNSARHRGHRLLVLRAFHQCSILSQALVAPNFHSAPRFESIGQVEVVHPRPRFSMRKLNLRLRVLNFREITPNWERIYKFATSLIDFPLQTAVGSGYLVYIVYWIYISLPISCCI